MYRKVGHPPRFFAEQAKLVVTHREVALRMLYMLISFVAIAFDFVMKDLAFAESPAKLAALNDGLRHGSQGATGTKRVLELATGLIEQYAPEDSALAPRIRDRLTKELDAIPTKLLAEYFAKQGVSQELFAIAKELEAAAYNADFVAPQALTAGAKGIIGVLLDFWDMDRKAILQNGDTAKAIAGSTVGTPKVVVTAQSQLPGMEGKEKS